MIPGKQIQHAILERASELAGSVERLAQVLLIPPEALHTYLRGDPIPTWLFLRTVDYVNEVQAGTPSSTPRPHSGDNASGGS